MRHNTSSITDSNIRMLAKDILRNLHFNNGHGFYFAINMDGIDQLHSPRIQDSDFDNENARIDEPIISEVLKIANNAGEGFF